MLKKFLLGICGLFILCNAFAQEKVQVQYMGKKKGTVSVLREGGVDYVAALPMAKVLKMKTSWFGKSGQLNMSSGNGYFCVIREDNIFATVNGKQERLTSAPIIKNKTLYAPLDFFEYGSLPVALGYDITLSSGVITVDKYTGKKTRKSQEAEPVGAGVPPPSILEQEEAELLDDAFFESKVASKPAPLNATVLRKGEPQTVIKKLEPSTPVIEKTASKKNRKIRVIIDAGHGGKDPGAVRSSVREKDINLKVAKQVAALLKKEKNFEVKLTRDNDTFIALGQRAKIANNFKADIFVSIHGNAAKRASANGFEVYFRSDKASDAEAAATAALENEALSYEGKSGVSMSFADLLLKSLAVNEYMNESSKLASHIRNAVSKNQRALGVKVFDKSSLKQANFYVLKGVESPSVLIEMGYLSNANDRKRLNTASVQNKMAAHIKDGIVSYAKAEGWK